MMKLWMLIVVAAMASACSKQDAEEFNPADNTLKTIQFTATGVGGGRTAFGDYDSTNNTYPTLWQEGDQIAVSLNLGTRDAVGVTISDEGKSATFAAELTNGDTEVGTFTFYAVSPADACTGTYYVDNESTDPRVLVRIKDTQTPQENSCDPLMQVLFAETEAFAEIPDKVQLSFKHWAAYGCLQIKNLTTTEPISKIQLEADGYLAGTTVWRPTKENDADKYYGLASKTPVGTITLNTTSVEHPLWFATLPIDLSGKEFTVRVVLESGKFLTKTITFANGDGNFQAGHIAKFSVNFEGITASEGFIVGSLYPASGTPEGVIFWVSDDGTSAKIASVKHISSVWMELPESATAYPNVGNISGSTPTGIENTNAIREDAKTNGYVIPMLSFIDETLGGGDWYWPTTSDLTEVYNEKATVDATLTTSGYRTFGDDVYWTSRQNSTGTQAYYVNFKSGKSSMNTKDIERYGRAVKIVKK